jgi:hypothetical protein
MMMDASGVQAADLHHGLDAVHAAGHFQIHEIDGVVALARLLDGVAPELPRCPPRSRPRAARRPAIRTSPLRRPLPGSASGSSCLHPFGSVRSAPRTGRKTPPAWNRSAGCWSPATWRNSGPGSAPARTGGRFRGAPLWRRAPKHLAIGLQPVKFLPQAGQRNHRRAAAQLRLAEHERQHGNEQVPLRHRQQLERIAGHSRTSISSTAMEPYCRGRVKREIHGRQSPSPAPARRTRPPRSLTMRRPPGHFRRRRPRTGTSFLPASGRRRLGTALRGCSGSDTVNVAPSPTGS